MASSERLRERLVDLLGIDEDQVYDIEGLIGMDDLFDIAGVSGHAELRYPAFSGSTQAARCREPTASRPT